MMKKTKVHQSNSNSGLKPVLIMSSDNDVKCDVRKNQVSHWIFKDVYHQFIVENVNTWDPHPISITNIETILKMYQTLADGEKGPQIAEHLNTVALQFPIKLRHTETIKILQNFIDHALTMVTNNEKVGEKLQDAYREIRRQKKIKKSGLDIYQKANSRYQPQQTKSENPSQLLDVSYGKVLYTFTDREPEDDIFKSHLDSTMQTLKRPVTGVKRPQ